MRGARALEEEVAAALAEEKVVEAAGARKGRVTMRRFKKVLDGLTAVSSSSTSSASSQPGNREADIAENLQSEHFQLCKVNRDEWRVCAITGLASSSSSLLPATLPRRVCMHMYIGHTPGALIVACHGHTRESRG